MRWSTILAPADLLERIQAAFTGDRRAGARSGVRAGAHGVVDRGRSESCHAF